MASLRASLRATGTCLKQRPLVEEVKVSGTGALEPTEGRNAEGLRTLKWLLFRTATQRRAAYPPRQKSLRAMLLGRPSTNHWRDHLKAPGRESSSVAEPFAPHPVLDYSLLLKFSQILVV